MNRLPSSTSNNVNSKIGNYERVAESYEPIAHFEPGTQEIDDWLVQALLEEHLEVSLQLYSATVSEPHNRVIITDLKPPPPVQFKRKRYR